MKMEKENVEVAEVVSEVDYGKQKNTIRCAHILAVFSYSKFVH